MTVKELLQFIDLTPIQSYQLNGENTTLMACHHIHANLEVKNIQIISKNAELKEEHIEFQYQVNDPSAIVDMTTLLPPGTTYIHVTLNIIV